MFSPHKTDTGAVLPWEYMPAAAGTYQAGQLLNAKNGSLTPVSAASTTTPGYLCMADITIATVNAGQPVPVTRIQNSVIYETQLSADAEDAAEGAMLQVSAGGLQADAAAVGTFEVTYIEATTAGAMVRGRFH
jgi:hypothetical protein